MQGRGPKQEDRRVQIPDLTRAAKALKMPIDHLDQPCALFAVYDGHRGTLCVEFVAKAFHGKLLKRLSANTDRSAWTDDAVSKMLAEICEEIDTEFLARSRTVVDGCTFAAALLTGTRLFVVWLGDVRCVVGQHQPGLETAASLSLTEDHRAATPAEAERIKQAGGVVIDYGNGYAIVAHDGYEERMRELRRAQASGLGSIGKEPMALNVSRAFGNRDFKAASGKALLVSTPGTRVLHLDRSHKFVALVCSGVPQVMPDADVVTELDLLRDVGDIPADVRAGCGALVQEAYGLGSTHNLTAILVRLQWPGQAPYPRKLASVAKAEKAAKALMEAAQSESAHAASKRRRLETAAAVSAQKKASYDRARAASDVAGLEAAEEARKEAEMRVMKAEIESEKREARRKAMAEAARKAREEAEREEAAGGGDGGGDASGGGLDSAEAFFLARRKQKQEAEESEQAAGTGLDAAEAFFAARRGQKRTTEAGAEEMPMAKAIAAAKAGGGEDGGASGEAKGLDSAEAFFAKRRAAAEAGSASAASSGGGEAKGLDAAEAFFAKRRASAAAQAGEKPAEEAEEDLTFL